MLVVYVFGAPNVSAEPMHNDNEVENPHVEQHEWAQSYHLGQA